MQKITPFLWFDGNAEEAAQLYTFLFPESEITHVNRCGEAGPGEPGSALVVGFTLFGQGFRALDGGPHFKFNEAVSFQVDCETQAEVDRSWTAGSPARAAG